MARYIKLKTDESEILEAINAYCAVTYHHSFNLSRQLERDAGHKNLISGEYIKIRGFKVHEPLFEEILKTNEITLARHYNTNYRKEFNIRFIKSRFGEKSVSFALGGSRVLVSDNKEAELFYAKTTENSIQIIVDALHGSGVKSATKAKRDLQKNGLIG